MEKKQIIQQKVSKYMEKYRMLQPGDQVVAGVSGGADSVCLLFLLYEYRMKVPFDLIVVHINHGIRPDAGQDAAYVEKLCDKWGIPFILEKVSVEELAESWGMSTEEAGRKARYDAFIRAAQGMESHDHRKVKLALAHHMGDRAETMLFHLFRGTGSRGLGSIQPIFQREKDQLTVIRPLLCLERQEIEKFLEKEGIGYCQDSTNFEDAYTRNKIRHHILPYAEEEICAGAVRNMNRAAEQMSQIEDYLEIKTEEAYLACVCGNEIDVEAFQRLHPLIGNRVLLEVLKKASPHHQDIGAVHVEALADLFGGASGRRVSLPFGITACREYKKVVLRIAGEEDMSEENSSSRIIELNLQKLLEEDVLEDFGDDSFAFSVFSCKKNGEIPVNRYTKWFDYDKIKDTLLIRTRQPGDYLELRSGTGESIRKSLKDYMINEKIPRELRDRLPVLVMGKRILWIPGYRISEAFKVDEFTERILQVTVTKNC